MPRMLSAQPSREEFLTWKDNPVSQWVFRALEAAAEAQQVDWLGLMEKAERSAQDPFLAHKLLILSTRAEAYKETEGSSYYDFCALNGQDPKAGEED